MKQYESVAQVSSAVYTPHIAYIDGSISIMGTTVRGNGATVTATVAQDGSTVLETWSECGGGWTETVMSPGFAATDVLDWIDESI